MPWVGRRSVIVEFPGHTNIFFSRDIVVLDIFSRRKRDLFNNNCVFSSQRENQTICCRYPKELSQWDGSIWHKKLVFKLEDRKIIKLFVAKHLLSYDVASGSEITPCNKIDKSLVVYKFTGNLMTSITTCTWWQIHNVFTPEMRFQSICHMINRI